MGISSPIKIYFLEYHTEKQLPSPADVIIFQFIDKDLRIT